MLAVWSAIGHPRSPQIRRRRPGIWRRHCPRMRHCYRNLRCPVARKHCPRPAPLPRRRHPEWLSGRRPDVPLRHQDPRRLPNSRTVVFERYLLLSEHAIGNLSADIVDGYAVPATISAVDRRLFHRNPTLTAIPNSDRERLPPVTINEVEAVTGPRELVHGERESFIGGYRWQRSGLGVGIPARNAGGGGCSRVSSR